MITGGEEMLEHACQKLGVRSGQTTSDGKLTVEFAECLGICDFAPAALADDGRIFGPLTPEKVDSMIEELKKGPVDPSHGLDPLLGTATTSASEV
jgi:NADH-quinone oxidoreductase subunit E